jgi:hypothetical protein
MIWLQLFFRLRGLQFSLDIFEFVDKMKIIFVAFVAFLCQVSVKVK